MKLKPAKKTVICTAVEQEKTKSGLTVVTEDTRPETGKVYAVGAGTPPVPMKVGDTIVYRKYSDNKVYIEGVEFNFINFSDIVAKKV